MAYNIEYDDNAIKQLKKIDKSQRDIILKWIKKNLNNSENPREKGKKLKGNLKDYWRYRVGKYRIITEINFVFEVLLNFIIFYLSSISLPYYTNSYSK